MTTGRDYNRVDLLVAGRRDQFRANAAIRPGVACKVDSAGEIGPWATDGTLYELIIALNKQKIGQSIDDAHADNDLVEVIYPIRGDVINIILESANDITLDDFLTVTSSGTFRLAASTETRVLRPLAVHVGTGSADLFMACRVL